MAGLDKGAIRYHTGLDSPVDSRANGADLLQGMLPQALS
jgi:hypothetical protein